MISEPTEYFAFPGADDDTLKRVYKCGKEFGYLNSDLDFIPLWVGDLLYYKKVHGVLSSTHEIIRS